MNKRWFIGDSAISFIKIPEVLQPLFAEGVLKFVEGTPF